MGDGPLSSERQVIMTTRERATNPPKRAATTGQEVYSKQELDRIIEEKRASAVDETKEPSK